MATRYLVTQEAVDAIEEGMRERGWGLADLGRNMTPQRSRQAIKMALNRIGGRSEFLLDMLIATGRPPHLAYALTDESRLLVERLGPHFEGRDAGEVRTLIDELETHLERVIALREKKKQR